MANFEHKDCVFDDASVEDAVWAVLYFGYMPNEFAIYDEYLDICSQLGRPDHAAQDGYFEKQGEACSLLLDKYGK